MGFGHRLPTIDARFRMIVSLDSAIAPKMCDAPKFEHSPFVAPPLVTTPSTYAIEYEKAHQEHISSLTVAEVRYLDTLRAWCDANELAEAKEALDDAKSPALQHAICQGRWYARQRRRYWSSGDMSHIGELIAGETPIEWTLRAPSAIELAMYSDDNSTVTTHTAQYRANFALVEKCVVAVSGVTSVTSEWLARTVPIGWIHEIAAALLWLSIPTDAEKKASSSPFSLIA